MTVDCLAPTGASVPWLLVIGALVLIGLATVLFLTNRKRKKRMLALSAVVAIGLVTVASLGAPFPRAGQHCRRLRRDPHGNTRAHDHSGAHGHPDSDPHADSAAGVS